ncbi:MAG: hypothetical protein KFH87_13780, partial [Bacteroidetes bacterium]|nr:hypothetical protein [Bacteroidota bacterium]
MKHHLLIILVPILFLLFPPGSLYGGPGDTLVVQTFTWDSPVNPGWNQPKEGRFFFPTADRQWERVLMSYTLKCDPSQNPPCGEWDYLTYARLYEHTGQYDSNQVTHPNFLAFGLAPDTLEYMHAPSPRFLPRLERRMVHEDTLAMHSVALGTGTMEIAIQPVSTTMDMRSYILWTSEELSSAGLRNEPLTGMRLHVGDVDGVLHRVTIRLRRYTGTGWSDAIPLRDVGFVTVYDAALTLTPQSWNSIQFTTPFTYWSGNILAEFTIDRIDGSGFTLQGDPTAEAMMFTSMEADELLYVQPRSHVRCGPVEDLNDAATLTLEAWINPETLQNWTNIVMKGVSNEQRIGIQLNPPDGGRSDVFCLVGNGSNTYGRTQNRPVNTNSWIHVAMVYDGSAPTQEQRLRLYLNGEAQTLDFNGNIPERTTSNDAPFTIATDGGSFFNGWMDEVRIWRAALSGEEIRERLHAYIDAGDPLYPSLISAWSFDEGTGNMAYDRTGANDGRLLFPQRQSWQGKRVRGFQPATFRPAITFEQGSFTSRTEERLVVDTLTQPPLMVVLYNDTTRANTPTDTLYVWPPYTTYTFDASGNPVDSTRVPADGSLLREDHFYYQTPYEILNRYELGRYITPYGIGLDLGEGWTWVYDVTDFLPLLRDSVHLTAGNFQELLDMKFIFIEGTPPRDVKSIR